MLNGSQSQLLELSHIFCLFTRVSLFCCPLFYGFANFYVLAAHPHQASLEQINRAKGRPPLQVGSITTTREHIPDLFDWHQLPKGLHKEQEQPDEDASGFGGSAPDDERAARTLRG
jgi:hypothetical protein